jgi:hypothetical protein
MEVNGDDIMHVLFFKQCVEILHRSFVWVGEL